MNSRYTCRRGLINGFIGVLIFSGSMPATKVALQGFSPLLISSARAAIAGLLSLLLILLLKVRRPQKKEVGSLIIVTIGVVVGFPFLSALALQHLTAADSTVFLAALPLMTATFGALRAQERPSIAFWILSFLGSSVLVGYAASKGLTGNTFGSAVMLVAVILCGLGYAEGGRLAKSIGGWQVISWALVLALPATLPLTLMLLNGAALPQTYPPWVGLLYVSVLSMLIGFIFWYQGLAQGGIATVGQLQLLQPFFALALSAAVLNEKITTDILLLTIALLIIVAAARKFSDKKTKVQYVHKSE